MKTHRTGRFFNRGKRIKIHKNGGFFSNPNKKEPSPSFQCSTRRGRPSGISNKDPKPLFILELSVSTAEGYYSVWSCIAWHLFHIGLMVIGVVLVVEGIIQLVVEYFAFGTMLTTFSIVSWLVLGKMLQVRKGEE